MSTTTLRITLIAAAGLSLVQLGCMKPNPLIYTLDDGLGDEGDSDASDTSEGDTGEGQAPLPDLAGDEALTCAALDEFDAACGACVGASCCELALECAAIEDCACLADCLLGGGASGACKNACGGTSPANVTELELLLTCASDLCEPAC